MATGRQHAEGMVKISEDLDRYRSVLRATRPEVIIECGSWQGGSAVWFARQGADVVSVDVADNVTADNRRAAGDWVRWITGSSTDLDVVARVSDLVSGRRTMVVLDSDHSAAHVRREIELYGPLVTPGCYLVVEDGIARWMPGENTLGSPLDAIEDMLVGSDKWERDTATEEMFPVSMHPAGWWVKW